MRRYGQQAGNERGMAECKDYCIAEVRPCGGWRPSVNVDMVPMDYTVISMRRWLSCKHVNMPEDKEDTI